MTSSYEKSIALEAAEREFRPLPLHLVKRYYGTRENYIAGMEQQAVEDRAEVDAAPSDAPADWRRNRLLNASLNEMRARLEREAMRHE